MSFEEKRAWLYAAVTLAVASVYGALVVLRGERAEYLWPLVLAVLIAVVLHIAATAGAAFFSPEEAGQTDERDTAINHFGQRIEYAVLVCGVLVVLALVVAGLAHFWLAQSLYFAFALSSFGGAVARIVSYRRGAPPW
jgi:ABC-type phosphate transport system auxiliary subunit